ncbi:hypothetical protein F4775DRAFT_544239, partial [Biscogniauxia sp. FL1348]
MFLSACARRASISDAYAFTSCITHGRTRQVGISSPGPIVDLLLLWCLGYLSYLGTYFAMGQVCAVKSVPCLFLGMAQLGSTPSVEFHAYHGAQSISKAIEHRDDIGSCHPLNMWLAFYPHGGWKPEQEQKGYTGRGKVHDQTCTRTCAGGSGSKAI